MSTETKFTPGPWRIDEANRTLVARLVDGEYEYICSVDPEEFSVSDMTDEENRANAALIAEAPKLYKTLEAMCAMWVSVCQSNGWDESHVVQYENALAVLKKARGE